MDKDTVKDYLQTYVDLATTDPFTGETFSKDLLNKIDTNRVTVCEEAIKMLDGEPESNLVMSKDEIAEYVSNACELFEKGRDEMIKSGSDMTTNSAVMQEKTIEAFNSVLDYIDSHEKENASPEI
ncbi:MAG: hypothetical protein IJK26_00115 [Clostridia bacterium]|nr:hypothetical protein [Clostridia bacterium]